MKFCFVARKMNTVGRNQILTSGTDCMTTQKKKQLKEFVEENHRLLSVFGIFGGLTAFFIQLGQDFLAVSSFFAFLLLLWEVMASFPKREEASVPLRLFEYAFTAMLFSLGWHLLTTYRRTLLQISYLPFLGLYAVIAIKVVPSQKINLLMSRIDIKSKKLGDFVRYSYALAIFALAMYLAFLSARLLQEFFG